MEGGAELPEEFANCILGRLGDRTFQIPQYREEAQAEGELFSQEGRAPKMNQPVHADRVSPQAAPCTTGNTLQVAGQAASA